MFMKRMIGFGAALSWMAWVTASATALDARVRMEWRFDRETQWHGWSPTAQLTDVTFADDHVAFAVGTGDPWILSPGFDMPDTSNHQWVEIDLACEPGGHGELYFGKTTTGQYAGLEPGWGRHFEIVDSGRHVVRIWPFWATLGKIARLRFDPPASSRIRLYAIRIMEADVAGSEPHWPSGPALHAAWKPMYAVRAAMRDDALHLTALKPQATVVTAVAPFDADRCSLLRLDARCQGERLMTLYWATEAEPGLFGQPIPLPQARQEASDVFDLRQFPTWKGTITHLALAFGTTADRTLILKHIAIEKNDPAEPFLRCKHWGFESELVRAGQSATLRAVLEHVDGPPVPAGPVTWTIPGRSSAQVTEETGWDPGETRTVPLTFTPKEAGACLVELQVGSQRFQRTTHVEPALPKPIARPADGYDVPEPKPVASDYEVGVYYFPGWSPEELTRRWSYQKSFPERDSLLGWYAEGRPEVADWHIKWAVENAISFFVYDWYWREGKSELTEGLEEGFLNARYRNMMKFAVMWANHPPFADHTREQMLAVTDYWIAHYFSQPNYLLVDGKPYVSFFDASRVSAELGGPETSRAVFDAMRQRVREAGFAGLHIGACASHLPAVSASLKEIGYDSITGYNYRRHGPPFLQTPYRQYILGHEAVWQAYHGHGVLPYIPLLTVGWESRPWDGPRAEQRFARTTADFKAGLQKLKTHLDKTGQRRAILEAWNEWGEGSYIEPNRQFGFGDVEAIREVFATPGDWPANVAPHDVGLAGEYDLRKDNN